MAKKEVQQEPMQEQVKDKKQLLEELTEKAKGKGSHTHYGCRDNLCRTDRRSQKGHALNYHSGCRLSRESAGRLEFRHSSSHGFHDLPSSKGWK